MPIENNPEIDESSEEETEVQYKKKPIIKKEVVRKPKVNKDIDELKKSIKILENIALTKSSTDVATKNLPKKKSRKIKQIIYESSDDEEVAQPEVVQPKVNYTQPKVAVVQPKAIAPKPRRRFIFKK